MRRRRYEGIIKVWRKNPLGSRIVFPVAGRGRHGYLYSCGGTRVACGIVRFFPVTRTRRVRLVFFFPFGQTLETIL